MQLPGEGAPSAPQVRAPAKKREQILVVDDVPSNLRLLTGALASFGYRVRAARDGAFALATAELDPPDLILLDVRMPEMDGYEVCRRLKKHPRLRAIPVVFISAQGEALDKVLSFQCGAVDYLVKPCALEELEVRIATHLRVRRQQRELALHARGLLRANRELEEFARVVSHDLKAPLRAIRTLSGIIQEDENLGDESRQHFSTLDERVDLAQTMIDELLAYCRSAIRPDQRVEVDTDSLIRDVIATVRPATGARIEIEGTWPRLCTYSSPLRHVLLNLVDNALKHHGTAEGAVRVGCRSEKEQDLLVFSVHDDGPGIPAPQRKQIFRLFRSFGKHQGSGVGLALAKRYVELLGGSIEVASGEGSGTTFTFTWPREHMLRADREGR